ncbi:MAG: hypothetical protein ACFFCI_09705 [Promethearchaeota archaeon]
MTILDNSVYVKNYGNTNIEIRDIDKYLKEESFCIPEDQDLPAGHYEFKIGLLSGIIRIGKTSLATVYLAYKAYEVWGDDIDFFIADDIYALVEAIAHSEKPVHYVILDDQIDYLDARDPSGNRKITQVFYKIAHELQNECIKKEGNLGGIVICMMLVQSIRAVDLRIREDFSMFTILKSHDKLACKMYEIDEEIQDKLKDWQVRSKRLTDYEARKHAFIVDEQKKGCMIEFDITDPQWDNLPFDFEIIEGIDRYRDQRNLLVDYLCSSFQLENYTDGELKGELCFKLDKLEENKEILYVTRNDLSEIIWRAKSLYKKLIEEKELQTIEQKIEEINNYREQKKQLVDYLCSSFQLESYTNNELKGELCFKLDELEENREIIYVTQKDLSEIIWKAKSNYKKQLEEKELQSIEQKIEEIKKYREQRNLLVDYLCLSFQVDKYTINELKGKLCFKLDELEKNGENININRNDLSEIIWRAKSNYKEIKEKESQNIEQKNQSDGWIRKRILAIHDSLNLSFKEMEKKLRIPHSTLHDWYHQEKNSLNELINKKEKGMT